MGNAIIQKMHKQDSAYIADALDRKQPKTAQPLDTLSSSTTRSKNNGINNLIGRASFPSIFLQAEQRSQRMATHNGTGYNNNRPLSTHLPAVVKKTINLDAQQPTKRVGKHHNQVVVRSPAIAELFNSVKIHRELPSHSKNVEYSHFLTKLKYLRTLSDRNSRPHTTPVATGFVTESMQLPAADIHLPSTNKSLRPATTGVLTAKRPDQRTKELRLPQLKETTLKSLSQGAAQQVRKTGLLALDELAATRAGIDYQQYGESLLDAAEAGSSAEILRLIDSTADIEYCDVDGFTPLIFAACNGWDAAVKILLQAKAEPLYRPSDGSSAIHVACQDGHTKVLRLLLAEVKAKVQSTDVLNDFLEQRPDIHPLNLAAREGHVKVIQILAEAKVQIKWCNGAGFSPVDVALEASQVEAVMVLTNLKASINQDMAKSYNTTALMNAVKSNDTCALQSVIASATEHVEEISSREDHDCSCEPLKHAQVDANTLCHTQSSEQSKITLVTNPKVICRPTGLDNRKQMLPIKNNGHVDSVLFRNRMQDVPSAAVPRTGPRNESGTNLGQKESLFAENPSTRLESHSCTIKHQIAPKASAGNKARARRPSRARRIPPPPPPKKYSTAEKVKVGPNKNLSSFKSTKRTPPPPPKSQIFGKQN